MAKGKEELDKQTKGAVQGAQQRAAGGQRQPGASAMERRGEQGVRGGSSASNPFSFMRRFSEDMDRLFAEFGFGPMLTPSGAREEGGGLLGRGASAWSPQIEVFRRNGRLVIRADVPGLSKEDVNVEIDNGELIVSGERKREQEEEREGWLHSERSYGSFCRTFTLPDGINPDNITANFQNGVLEIEMEQPAEQEQKTGRRIEVREGPVH